ncbi:MAG: response regulator [Planctomycetota bacterium]|nr:response regulator [Planctomycetota bacterium]
MNTPSPQTQSGYGFNILVVEDDEEQLLLNAALLQNAGFETTAVTNAKDAVEMLTRDEFQGIVCDLGLPGMSGAELLRFVRLQHKNLAFLMLTGHDEVNTAVQTMQDGADEYLLKPISPMELSTKLLSAIATRRDQSEVAKREREPLMNIFRGVNSLVAGLEEKDTYTKNHSKKVATASTRMAQELPGITRQEILEIRYGALLHDVGKIAVPLTILHKTSKLTDEEWEVIKHHPIAGGRIVKPLCRDFPEVHRIVRYEHERWDGNGYTEGLAEEKIPLGSRLVMIADAFDAICSRRSYSEPQSKDEALRIIKDGAGSQFDPGLVPIFEKVLDDLPHPSSN